MHFVTEPRVPDQKPTEWKLLSCTSVPPALRHPPRDPPLPPPPLGPCVGDKMMHEVRLSCLFVRAGDGLYPEVS